MKTRLGTWTGLKNPRRRVQNAPEHGRTFWCPKAPFGTFGVSNDTLKGPNFPLLGFGPTPFG